MEENTARSPRVIDMRSDTISMPTDEMRQAMAEAAVGDDVYQEDPTAKALEERAAELFGKEGALFVPSCTMGNLIAVLIHCRERGSEAILGDKSHIFKFEQGGISQLGGVIMKVIPTMPDGTFCLEDIQSMISSDDVHYGRTKVLCLENTHNMCGGKILPVEYLDKVTQFARTNGIPAIHMDGARIFNAAVALKVPVSRLVQDVDSVSCCLSKGLCAPVGAVVVGSRLLIDEARRLRKALGGGMRQVGHMAAAGLVSLNKMVERLDDDHRRTYRLASAITAMNSPFLTVDLSGVHTNIVFINLQHEQLSSDVFCQRLKSISENERTKLKDQAVVVQVFPFGKTSARAVVCNNLNDEDIDLAVLKLKFLHDECYFEHFLISQRKI